MKHAWWLVIALFHARHAAKSFQDLITSFLHATFSLLMLFFQQALFETRFFNMSCFSTCFICWLNKHGWFSRSCMTCWILNMSYLQHGVFKLTCCIFMTPAHWLRYPNHDMHVMSGISRSLVGLNITCLFSKHAWQHAYFEKRHVMRRIIRKKAGST